MPIFETLTGRLLDTELRTTDSTVRFTTQRRQDAINDGVAEFAHLTECFRRTSTITCSCNTATYDLLDSAITGSTDFVRLAPRGVEFHFTDSNGLLTQLAGEEDFPRRDIEWLNTYSPGWRTSTRVGMPTGYYIDDVDGQMLLGLDTRPDIGSSESAKLIVPYTARPARMTSSGDQPYTVSTRVRIDLVPYHQAAVHYGAAQLEKLRGDWEAVQTQLALFQGYVDRFMAKKRQVGGNFVRLAKNYLKSAKRNNTSERGSDPYWQWP